MDESVITDHENETAHNPDSEPLTEEELLLEVVRFIVRKPEKVSIDVARGKTATLLTISVAPEDRGQVIGKGRQTFKALIHILTKGAFLDNKRRVMLQMDGQDDDFREQRNNNYRKPNGGHRNSRYGPPREYRR